jgi:tetratricopeptide (TPR) repeat protein
MMNNFKEPGKLLYFGWNPNLDEVSIEQLDHYVAVENFLTDEEEPPPDAENLEKVQKYLEAFHHLYEVVDWKRVIAISAVRIFFNEELHNQLFTWGYYSELAELYNKLLNIPSIELNTTFLYGLGKLYYAKGKYRQAIDFYDKCLKESQGIKDFKTVGAALNSLGLSHFWLGGYDKAINCFQQRLVIAWENNDYQGEGAALNNLGLVYSTQGKYRKAIKYQNRGREILHIIGDRSGEGTALGSLGTSYAGLGHYDKGIECQKKYLGIMQEIQDVRSEGDAWGNLGTTLAKLNRNSEALEYWQAALGIYKKIGSRSNEALILKNLAALYQILGDTKLAYECCVQALAIATELDIPLAKECQELKKILELIYSEFNSQSRNRIP